MKQWFHVFKTFVDESKASSPIVAEDGITTSFKHLHSKKQYFPIEVTEGGIDIWDKLLHPLKA